MKINKKLFALLSAIALLLLGFALFLCIRNIMIAEASKKANENAYKLLLALERWASDDENSSYPADLNLLVENGYLKEEISQNPFAKRPTKAISVEVSYLEAKDLYRGKRPIPKKLLTGLEKGDVIYVAVERPPASNPRVHENAVEITNFLIFLIENPDWKEDWGGSPAMLMLYSTGFDFKFASLDEMEEFYSNCPYSILP